MIQIRKSMFETNSSSCHVFVYKPGGASVPSTVELRPGSNETILDVVFNDFYKWFRPGRTSSENDLAIFIDYLFEMGVRTIKCSDRNVKELIQHSKNPNRRCAYGLPGFLSVSDLRDVLFGDDTQLTTMEDYLISDEEIEKQFGKGVEYAALRPS